MEHYIYLEEHQYKIFQTSQENRVATILKYKKNTIDHDIYIKVFTNDIVSYLTVSTDDVINTTNNETSFTELTRVFKELFEMKVQEGSVIKYLNFRICQSPLGFSVYQNGHIMERQWKCIYYFLFICRVFTSP